MTHEEVQELFGLLSEYGHAKFGDEWWPGNAAAWIGREKAARLEELLEQRDPVYDQKTTEAGWRQLLGSAREKLEAVLSRL